jgi:lipopolysaccharide biosynthesis glycosyltransferase
VNKIVVIANARFEKGLIAFINSYRKVNMQSPLVIIDTGLENSYPYETIKVDSSKFNKYKKAEWMKDASAYLQCELINYVNADKLLYLEADMLLLKNMDNVFDDIKENNVIGTMDDAAFATMSSKNYIDNCGRFFIEGSPLREKYARCKGWNCGFVGGSSNFYRKLADNYGQLLNRYENQYRLLAQSLLNQYYIVYDIPVYDVGLEYNFSGINEYYDKPNLYRIVFDGKEYEVDFNNKSLSVIHFTGKNKPFLVDDINIMSPVFDYFYNKGELFNAN